MTWVKNYLLRFRLNENSKCTLDSVGGQTDHHHLPLFATESPSSDSKLARNDVRVALGKAISLKELKKQTLSYKNTQMPQIDLVLFRFYL